MGRKQKRRSRADRRADKILSRARLKSRVIVAEAAAAAAETRAIAAETRVDAAESRIDAFADLAAESRRTRTETDAEVARILADARVQAEYIVAQARVVAEAQSEATQARAELQAERLQTTASAALDQARAEVLAERKRAEADLAEEQTRLRDQALLEAARIRDEAHATARAELAAAETERERILADAHAEAFEIVDRARNDSSADVPHDELWDSFEAHAAFDDQPLLAVDGLPVTPDPVEEIDPAPFELTPLAIEPAEQPPREAALVDLATFWQEEAEGRAPRADRRRLRRRARRS